MVNFPHAYEDWKDFFTKRLIGSGTFRLSQSFSRGDTDIEVYSALTGNTDTTMQVGYLSPKTLIYVQILNPSTPGKNRQQQIEHLYKYEFDDENQYGPPGLDFDEVNVRGISNHLDQGFNGNEIVYYRKGTAVKSRLTTSYYPDSPQSTITYHFHQEPFFRRLLNKFTGKDEVYDEIKTIDLRQIFNGLNSS